MEKALKWTVTDGPIREDWKTMSQVHNVEVLCVFLYTTGLSFSVNPAYGRHNNTARLHNNTI